MKHYYLIFIFLVSVTASFAQTLEDDRLALIAFYQSTSGDNWTNKVGWNPLGPVGDNPCGWYGVTCTGGRVTELNLRNNRTLGSLPAAIGNLSALKILNLNANAPDALQGTAGIGGNIPSELGNLINLEYLDLRGNRFTGSIPPSLGNLENLTFLDISYVAFDAGFDPIGNLEGTIPIEFGNLKNLKHLDLSYQNLSGNLPVQLGDLTGLETLDLGANMFSGTIPASFGNLVNLKVLNLSYYGDFVRGYGSYGTLRGPIPDLSSIPVTSNISISHNSFNFEGMESNISRLDVYQPQAYLPMLIGNSPKLRAGASGISGVLSVDAGGTLANNTYKWYRNGILVATNIGSDIFFAINNATYRVEVTNAFVTGFKLISDNYTVTALPVTLASLSGKTSSEGNLLTWKTTSETSNKGFQIEKSADAKTFETIGFVDGMGDHQGDKMYNFLDAKPYFKTYYRLKQIDWDNKSEYSRIISVKREKSQRSIYPNPAKDAFFVSGLDQEEVVEIRNVQGRIVLEQKVNPEQPIPTDKLLNGLYLIKVGEESRKLVIQH